MCVKRILARKDFPKNELSLSQEALQKYLLAPNLSPTAGRVKEKKKTITTGKKTTRAKARAIYDWIMDKMFRYTQIKGCGLGEVESLLESLGVNAGIFIEAHAVTGAVEFFMVVASCLIYG